MNDSVNQQAKLDQPLLSPTIAVTSVTYGEAMRAIALTMVVWIHVASIYIYGPSQSQPDWNWISANWLMAPMRPAVLLFVMLSGAVMLPPHKAHEPISVFLKKRVTRIFGPFLFWNLMFFGVRMWNRGEQISLGQAGQAMIQGTVSMHFWYVYMLLGLYVITPMLRFYLQAAPRQNVAYTLVVLAIGTFLGPMVQHWFGSEAMLLRFWPWAGYLFFYLAGYYFHAVRLPRSLYWMLPVVMLILAAGTAQATYWLTLRAGKLDDTWYGSLTPSSINIAVMTLCSFLWLKQLPYDRWMQRWKWLRSTIKILSRNSFGIYLSHIIAIELLQSGRWGFTMTTFPGTAMTTIPLFTIVVMSLSLLAVQLIRLLPGGKLAAT
jgi:surface polysaccharide O-acyltransferase-like enzyme